MLGFDEIEYRFFCFQRLMNSLFVAVTFFLTKPKIYDKIEKLKIWRDGTHDGKEGNWWKLREMQVCFVP